MPSVRALVGLGLVALARAAPAEHKITGLPGAPANLSFSQYAGSVEVDADLGKSLFYWFVESQSATPMDDPLLLWLNGGPGSSSIGYGFMTEHGPFRVAPDGATLEPYAHAWNRDANIVYVESPAGVGFSTSNSTAGLSTNDQVTAANMYTFLDRFLTELYPEYLASAFYIVGESYGGHYVPTTAYEIFKNRPSWYANFKGFGIGNPGIENDWYYNVNEFAFVTFAYQHGLLPQPAYLAAEKACGWAGYLTDCGNETFYDTPSDACKAATTAALRYLPSNLDPYDVTAPTCQGSALGAAHVRANAPFLERLKLDYGLDVSFDPCLSDYVETYLNRADVQAAIHARPTTWRASGGVDYDNPGDLMVPYFETFINETDWRMLIWSGDADAAVPYIGTQRWIECLGRPVAQDWAPWYTDDATFGPQVGGMVKVFDRISFLTVKGCGHTVQTYCPQQGYDYYHQWLTLGQF